METKDRVQIAYINEGMLIRVLEWLHAPLDNYLIIQSQEALPDGARIVRVWHDPMRRAMVVMLEHESFPIVEPGEEPRVLSGLNSIILHKIQHEGSVEITE